MVRPVAPFSRGAVSQGLGIFIPESAQTLVPFADNAARDVWANANPSDLLQSQTVIFVTGTPDVWYIWRGASNPTTPITSTDWQTYTSVVRGSAGPSGPAGPAGSTGSARNDVEITADTTINATNIDTYRNNNVVNRTASGDTNITLASIASFLSAVPGDEFSLYFINEAGGNLTINAAFLEVFARVSGPIILGPGESAAIKLPSGGGTRWAVISDTAQTSGGTPPTQPQTIPAGNVVFRGNWNPTTGAFPASASQGGLYEIVATGTVDSIQFNQGDFILAVAPTPSTTIFAGSWEIISGSAVVHTWAGISGIITDSGIVTVLNRLGYNRNSGLGWDFSNGITTADPGAGNVALNNAAKASATIVTFNVASAIGGARFDEVLTGANIGDRVFVQSRDTPAKSALYRISSAPVQTIQKVDLEVVNERAAGGEFTDTERLNVMLFFEGVKPVPSLHNFAISIPSRVDLNTDLNVQQTITFDVTNHSRLTALELIASNGDNKTLTLPTSDGSQSQTVTLTNTNTSTQGTATYQLQGTYAEGTVNSNQVSISIQNVAAGEQGYYAARTTNDFSTAPVGELTSVDVTAPGTVFDIVVSAQNGETLGILLPQDRNAVSILNTVSGRFAYNPSDPSVTSVFTFTEAVRNDIDATTYDLLTTVNNSGFTATFNYRVTVES